MAAQRGDFIGDTFGMLTAVEVVGKYRSSGDRIFRWKCDCGGGKVGSRANARVTPHCGCQTSSNHSKASTKHGHSKNGKSSPTYNSYTTMTERCLNPNATGYASYGGRGITICERWIECFQNFLDDMGVRPEGKTLDRINNDGNYSKENCRWSTRKEQSRNCRTTRRATINGVTKPMRDWADSLGINFSTVRARIACGWCIESALTTKVKTKTCLQTTTA